MARKHRNPKKSKHINFQVTPRDHALLHSLAHEHGLSLTDYLLQKLKEEITIPPQAKEKSAVWGLSSVIPRHSRYVLANARYIYLESGSIVAQGIMFDGIDEEQYLILARTNGGRRWVWTQDIPEYDERRLLWSADTGTK